jgi:hypothetical protein
MRKDIVSDTELPEPPNLRFLRRLVTVLTAVMILGLITVVTLLVIRLQAPRVATPDTLALPEGVEVFAVTQTPTRWIVTSRDDRLFLFDGEGALLAEIPLGSVDN